MKLLSAIFKISYQIVFLFVVSAYFMGCVTPSSNKTASEDQKLTDIIKNYSEASKKLDAFSAPYFNVEENLNKFGDYLSPEIRERRLQIIKRGLSELSVLDQTKLSEQQNVAYELFNSDLKKGLKEYDFRLDYFSFDQMGNRLRSYIDDSSPALTSFPFDTPAHFEAFVQRSEGFPPFIDRQIQNLEEGAKAGYALNCTIAKSAIETYKEALEPVVEKNPFFRPALMIPATFTEAEKTQITAHFKTMVSQNILPAFQKFDKYYKNTYLPKCRKTYGLSKVPRGSEIYRYMIQSNTDLDLDPKEIHQIGLNEVARIKKELQTAFTQLGYKGSLKDSMVKITKDPKSYFTSVKEMFDVYAAYRSQVAAEIPKSFSLQPKADFKIVEGENPEDASGSYRDPTDFVPYGRFVVNAKNLKATPRWGVNTLFLHEAIPGHHFHLALQYEMKDKLSEYQRKMFWSNAFTEGWALYSERWGREAGLVSDPGQMVGSLSDEMLRAVRLVVDTGIHSYGWSRQKVMAYMAENLTSDARDIQIEADRYSVWPGQALGYKIGQLKILELRERAKKALGAKFDLKEFHRVVIGNGTLSLPVLEKKVIAWIESAGNKTL